MKFKFKSIVLALSSVLALSAASASSAAALSSTGGGDIFLVAYDSASKNTFVANLTSLTNNVSLFASGVNLTTSFSGDSAWNSFTGSGTAASSVSYEILGLNVGSIATQTTLLATNTITGGLGASGNTTSLDNITSSGQIANFLANYTSATNVLLNNEASLSGSSAGGLGNKIAGNMGNFNSLAAVGANDSFYRFLYTDPSAPTSALTKTLLGTWSLATNGSLTYSSIASITPVPESGTLPMMVFGIGLLGMVARRRASKS